MSDTRKIQCPSCGSNSTYKLFDGSYKCNYCQGSFLVNERVQNRQAAVNPTLYSPSAARVQKIIVLVGIVSMFLAMGIVAFLMTAAPDKTNTSAIHTAAANQPVIKNTMAFTGTAGSVIWIISEKQNSVDSLCYELLVVEPQTVAIKGKRIIVPPFKPDAGFDVTKKLADNFWQYGDLAYNISDDNGLVAYNIYTGKVVLDPKLLSEKFPELRSGILKAEHEPSKRIFKITTVTGDVLDFDPFLQAFIAGNTSADKKEEPVTKDLYLSDGLKHHLYLFTKRGNGFPIVFGGYVQESQLPEAGGRKENNVKDVFGNLHIEKVSEKNYFRAQALVKDAGGNLLVFYKTDLTETSPVILESLSKEGKTNWSLQDSLFAYIPKAFGSEDLGCDYTFSENTLILKLSSGEPLYMGIDISTGNVLWTFSPWRYARKQAS